MGQALLAERSAKGLVKIDLGLGAPLSVGGQYVAVESLWKQ